MVGLSIGTAGAELFTGGNTSVTMPGMGRVVGAGGGRTSVTMPGIGRVVGTRGVGVPAGGSLTGIVCGVPANCACNIAISACSSAVLGGPSSPRAFRRSFSRSC